MTHTHLRLLLTGVLALLVLGCNAKKAPEITTAAPDKFEWLTDFKKAQAEAKARNRPLLIEFTGSDWCPPCIQMKRDIFSTSEFQTYAAKNLVLLELDFPRGKEQPREVAAQNMELAQHFRVEGFPFILLLRSDGSKLVERVGYAPETAVAFIAWLEKARKG